MHIYDITLPLSPSLPCYPGDPQVNITSVADVARGDSATVSCVTLSSHSGTHIDAPRHFFPSATPVDCLDFQVLLGLAYVYEFPHATPITAADLHSLPLRNIQRLLLKTPNSSQAPSLQPGYVALSASAATLLVECGVQLVGIDALSIDLATATDFPVHRILLAAGVVILEGLNLAAVSPGEYELLALPLRLPEGDGAPARVILRQGSFAMLHKRPARRRHHHSPARSTSNTRNKGQLSRNRRRVSSNTR